MRTDLHDDPHTIGLMALLSLSSDTVVGKLHRLWSWADKHTSDGWIPNVTPAWIDDHVKCPGFVKALEEVGWLIVKKNGVIVPDFLDHNGASAKRRAEDAERKRKDRQGVSTTHTVRKMSAKIRTKSGPEKRREEKRREDQKIGSADVAKVDLGGVVPPGRNHSAMTLATYLDQCEAAGVDPIPADDPIFEYAKLIKLPKRFITLAWHKFVSKYEAQRKLQKSWRQTFQNAIEGDWLKLWYVADDNNGFRLTTAGRQAEVEVKAREAARA